ncbi:hypothetical protein AB0J86_11170 [Micromonospora sp. NPDC049559]|uniref:hypothetical protein n=1 Tax=Micromonospora sp. NPDC049559 TaxID=3155923 RepID=UPI0034450216
MERPLSVAALMLGVVLGLSAGIAFAVAWRAWVDYRKTRELVPGMRRTAWTLTRVATTRGGVILLLCIAAVGWAALSGGGH